MLYIIGFPIYKLGATDCSICYFDIMTQVRMNMVISIQEIVINFRILKSLRVVTM